MSDITPNYSTQSVFESTYRLTCEVKLKGVIVECGVASGSNFAQMIKASIDSGIDREYYGFDSFQGIPYAGVHDATQPGIGDKDMDKIGLLESSGITVHSKQSVIENLSNWGVYSDKVHLVEGWFQDTLPKNKIKSISVLRLDGDLYDSTYIALKYLYPKVEKGGLIIIDDWQLIGCRKAVMDYIKEHNLTIEFIPVDYTIIFYKP